MAIKHLTCRVCTLVFSVDLRGRPPSTCPDCKADPVQVKKQQQIDSEERKAAARQRVDNLETRLKASASRERRSYNLAELEDRIYQLEEWRNSLASGEALGNKAKDSRKRV